MTVSIIIPNWNGKKLLEKNLPSVLAVKPEELIIVDDGSSDDSVSFLRQAYPQVKLVMHSKNLGFSSACNDGVAEARGDFIVLLNSDVVPDKDILKYVLLHFNDPEVFAVSFNEKQWSWARLFWKSGYVEHEPGQKTDKTHITAWASGGSSIFRKSIWQKLGGFDTLYNPFYWEDLDLSYRAWKRGFKILWEPKAIVQHEHEAIIGTNFSKSFIRSIAERNKLIFIWKNITDIDLFISHKIHLLWRLRSPLYLKIFLKACLKFPSILSKRSKEGREKKISDKEILSMFK